jgi:hypothetical protein
MQLVRVFRKTLDRRSPERRTVLNGMRDKISATRTSIPVECSRKQHFRAEMWLGSTCLDFYGTKDRHLLRSYIPLLECVYELNLMGIHALMGIRALTLHTH